MLLYHVFTLRSIKTKPVPDWELVLISYVLFLEYFHADLADATLDADG